MTVEAKPQMLHLLLQAPEVETAEVAALAVAATCGHRCVAGPSTHDKFKDETFDHVVYCLVCFNGDTN